AYLPSFPTRRSSDLVGTSSMLPRLGLGKVFRLVGCASLTDASSTVRFDIPMTLAGWHWWLAHQCFRGLNQRHWWASHQCHPDFRSEEHTSELQSPDH